MPQSSTRRMATLAIALTTTLLAGATLAASAFTIPKAENTNAIAMQNDLFGPVVAVVQTGATVTWTNQDATAHSVVGYPKAPAPFDITVAPGKTGHVTFTKPGVYRYYSKQDASYDAKLNAVKANAGTPAFPSPMRGVVVVLGKNDSLATTASDTVNIPDTSMMFEPWAITVKAGTTVTWTNNDEDMHVAATVPGLAAAAMPTLSLPGDGGTASHTFSQPGVYYYYCPVHADWSASKDTMVPLKSYGSYPYIMDGLIIVTP